MGCNRRSEVTRGCSGAASPWRDPPRRWDAQANFMHEEHLHAWGTLRFDDRAEDTQPLCRGTCSIAKSP